MINFEFTNKAPAFSGRGNFTEELNVIQKLLEQSEFNSVKLSYSTIKKAVSARECLRRYAKQFRWSLALAQRGSDVFVTKINK